ncbi:MAG: hypothetical protein ACI915_003777 [Gammaproteobacteria bacterium]|jgi:hypothetical protein
MNEFESRFARWVVRYRWLVIVVSLVLVALAASGARHLSVTNSYRVYFGPEDPHRVAFEALENTYTKEDNVLIVIAPKNGEVFTRETLSVIESMTEKAWQLPFSTRVDSLTNFQHTEADGDDLIVADLVKNAAELDGDALDRVKTIALAEPLLRKLIISPDAKVTAVNVNVQLPGLDEAGELPSVINHARAGRRNESRESRPRFLHDRHERDAQRLRRSCHARYDITCTDQLRRHVRAIGVADRRLSGYVYNDRGYHVIDCRCPRSDWLLRLLHHADERTGAEHYPDGCRCKFGAYSRFLLS